MKKLSDSVKSIHLPRVHWPKVHLPDFRKAHTPKLTEKAFKAWATQGNLVLSGESHDTTGSFEGVQVHGSSYHFEPPLTAEQQLWLLQYTNVTLGHSFTDYAPELKFSSITIWAKAVR